MTQALQELGALIASKRPDCVLSYDVSFDELTIVVAPSNIVGLVDFLKSNRSCRFSTLVDITAVDYPGREKRFDVVYHLLSMYQNHRVRLSDTARKTWVAFVLAATNLSLFPLSQVSTVLPNIFAEFKVASE